MENNTQNNIPNNNSYIPIPPGVSPQPSVGPIVAVIIIVLLLILGAFYFWGKVLVEKNKIDEAYTQEEFKKEFGDQKIDNQNVGNVQEDLSGMEAELDLELNKLDSEIESLESEI